MKVSSIQQLSYSGISKRNKNSHINNPSKFNSVNFGSSGEELSNYLQSSLYIYQMDKLKKETQQFPKDIEYRTNLMKNAGLNPVNPHKLRSIIGPEEIKSIMERYTETPQVYSTGENDKNILNHTMRANMHIHTTASDGSMTVTELLDKAADYANKVKSEFPEETEPFVIAITDHDTTDGAKEAIKVISEKPIKYKNLRVILGVEMTAFENIAPDIVKAPTNTHILFYGIDPNEPTFNNFIDYTKKKKLQIEKEMLSTANKVYEKHFGQNEFYSITGAKDQFTALDKNIIGIYNGMNAHLKTKAVVEQVVLKDKELTDTLKKHNIPTDTEGFMIKLNEFNAAQNGNNKVQKPVVSLPEFITTTTRTENDKEKIAQKISNGIENGKVAEYLDDLKSNISEYKVTLNPKHKYMPNFEILNYNLANQPNVIVGIAHPVDYVKKVETGRYKVLGDLYTKFKSVFKENAVFSEVYYQSYCGHKKEINDASQGFFNKISKTLGLLKTGSYDSHGFSIFRRL